MTEFKDREPDPAIALALADLCVSLLGELAKADVALANAYRLRVRDAVAAVKGSV